MLLHSTLAGLALAWALILTGCWLGSQLLRQNGRVLLRLDELEKRLDELEFGQDEARGGLPAGCEAPAFELRDLAGEPRSLVQFRGRPVLLIFFNPACGFCRELLPKLVTAVRQEPESNRSLATNGENSGSRPVIVVVTTGDPETSRKLFSEHQLDTSVLLQKEMEVAGAYKSNGTPSGYLIDSEGKIASPLAIGGDALLALLTDPSKIANNAESPADRFSNHSLAKSKIKRDGLKAGTPAPEFRLPRLDGRGELSLLELRGRRVLLIFSSPQCGPCNTLAPELEKFHRAHAEIEVVMISKGERKENRAKVKEYGLTLTIVLQQQWEISRRYAMFSTPIAYLIDETGKIEKDVVVGVEFILALMEEIARSRRGAGVATADSGLRMGETLERVGSQGTRPFTPINGGVNETSENYASEGSHHS